MTNTNTNNDKRKHVHRRFTPGDQAVLICRCKHKDKCCVTDHIGKEVTVVDYAENVLTAFTGIAMVVALADIEVAQVFNQDYIIGVEDGLALVWDYQLMPLDGHTKKNVIPEKPEVVH